MNRTFPELPAETEDFRTGNAIHSRFRDILLISVLSVICSMDTSAETAMLVDHQKKYLALVPAGLLVSQAIALWDPEREWHFPGTSRIIIES